ncbi:uncharacterized protein nrm isoform X1 [Drosophila kikkawai]|uniref:Uncharacterized protein nrm isoform X1 n=1 Tax=Drosophila kikkawai TaxID=30033 RepID=A0ABM4GES9_DROKI
MAQRILKNRVFNTKRKPSKADPSLIKLGFTALLYLALIHQTSAQIDQIISEQESKSVVLQCPVNEDKCGKLHSLNWFKGDDRIAAMLLGENNATSVNKDFEERVTVDTSPYRLVIKDLKISDEGTYLCDTTFFIPEETCDNFNGYRVDLRVLVPPSEVFILDAKGDRIENGTTVGPMQERQSLKATCTVKNTRPQPEVGWFRGTKRLTTYSPTHNLNDGLYTSTLELDWTLSRDDLAQDIECRVNSAAILNSIVSTFGVDLQVRPTSIEINGVEHHTVQGSKVVLTCDIHGARPAVNLTWYNSTSIISADENDLTEIRIKAFEKIDGTYHTQSELIFNATRFENDRVFRCEAENIVLQINREKPISSALTLEVLYPPVVKVSPPDMVTNTSEIVLLNCEYVANPASLIQVDWYRNDELLNVNDTDHYQGGNSENVALVIKSTDKDDIGNYSCQLSNTIGKGISEEKINLDVQFVPSVEVQMIPAGPVKESDESNVTLYCNILDANPSVLTKVRWYANSTLLKELPDCEETREDLCHIDPSKLLLESIGRGFFYNYSCEGFNAAGWGPRSEDKELIVHYEPGPATLTHFPLIAVKKKSVIFSCSVDDPGYPDSNRFVAQQAKHIQKITKTQYPPLIDFHTVQALQPQEADIALEAFMLQKQQERLRSNAPSHSYSKNETASASHQVHQLKETHALIDFSLNQSLCTLLTLTTYTSQLQILTLYSDEHKNSISNASALSYSLYRKMGKFSFVAQLVSKPNRYRWLRGGRGPLQDVVTKDWTVEPVGLDSRTNYSCYAYNEGGKGLMATVNLEVHAPPFFIKNLAPYTGILHTSSNATLTCRIECVPRCDIHWQKDGVLIERNNSRYFVKEKYMEASPATGDFESILSVLHFNMPNWPRNKFDIDADNANYSCTSTPNTVGAGIKSATYFSIEYSPDNTTVSENITFVQEDTVPGRLICKSRANPEPSYKWFFKNETIGNGNALIINTAMKRSDNGTYTCLAYNKHGSSRAETVIIVQFTPNCEIERREIDGQDTLICTAFGNPEEADFSWSIKAENETVELLGSGDKKDSLDKSYYILQEGYAIARTYRCVANNTVGSGSFCEFEVAEQLAWWQIWEKTTLIVLVAAILGLLLIVIIICCIIICVCRRRRRQDKLHDKSSSLGEPLTEPGEYENLPFHGLQTAPNKFSATPTSFNNNTNMEHFVPRSERLHGDISKLSVLHQQPQQTPQHHFTYAHAFSDHEVEKNYSSQYIMHRLPTTYQDNRSFNEPVSAHNELQNVSNVFSKNNPEHFQRDQHKNKNTQISDDATQKINTNSLSDVQLLNDRDQDYQSTYATVERTSLPPNVPNTLLLSTNPFLTSSKSNNYNTVGEDELEGTARGKFSKTTLARDNQFYSLKLSSATKIKKKACNVNCSMGLTTSPSSLTKCKKKHSLAGNKHCLMETTSQPMRHYDYENVANKTTSSQNVVHMDGGRSKLHSISNLATVELHAHPYDKDNTAVVQKKKKHHHRYHQKNDALSAESCAEFPLMEPECISIYRSDSGISNSSYESQLPTALSQHPQSKITKNSSSGSLCRKPIKRNMEAQTGIFPHGDLDQEIKWPKEPALTKSQLKDVGEILAYEPASVPRSATSYNSIRSDVTVLEKKESVEADMSTPKASDQYQLGHQLKHSETPSSVSAKSALEMTTPAKCSEISNHDKQIKWLANNPFLAKNGKSNDSGNNNKGNLRRQTISDPYFHIKRQPYGALAPDNPTRLSEEWQIKNTTSNATSKIAARSNEENNERLLEPRKWLVEKPRLNYVPHKEDFPAQILPEVLKEPLEGVHYDYLVSSRPIRLPLRKHHTFHFQNSQTANGKLHQLRQQLQHHLRDRIKFEQENGFSYCPLQHVFKPISPIPSVTASIEEFKTKKKGELSSSEQEYDHYSKEADDDEDPGYSFCEEESIVDNDNYPTLDNLKSYS